MIRHAAVALYRRGFVRSPTTLTPSIRRVRTMIASIAFALYISAIAAYAIGIIIACLVERP